MAGGGKCKLLFNRHDEGPDDTTETPNHAPGETGSSKSLSMRSLFV